MQNSPHLFVTLGCQELHDAEVLADCVGDSQARFHGPCTAAGGSRCLLVIVLIHLLCLRSRLYTLARALVLCIVICHICKRFDLEGGSETAICGHKSRYHA